MRLLRAVLPLAVAAGLAAVSGGVTAQAGPDVPPVSDAARAAGFVDVRTVVSDAIIDLRYATTNNFTRTQLYPSDARCLVHQSMASGRPRPRRRCARRGISGVLGPSAPRRSGQDVQRRPQPGVGRAPRPVCAQPRVGALGGRDVHDDATAVRVRPTRGRALPGRHGHRFDDFTSRANAFATQGVSADAQANRAALRDAMKYGGLAPYSGEWWHFDGPGAGAGRPILDVPVD